MTDLEMVKAYYCLPKHHACEFDHGTKIDFISRALYFREDNIMIYL